MADYVTSLLLAFQGQVDKRLNAAEVREIKTPILEQALKSADLALGGVQAEQIRQSTKRSVYTYALNKVMSTGETARALAPTGTQSSSTQVTLTWVTFAESMELWNQTNFDNVISRPEALQHQISEMMRNLRERVGTYIVQELHSNRTQVSRAVTNGVPANAILGSNVVWDSTNYCYANAADQSSYLFQNAANVMKQSNYYDQYIAVADPSTFKQADFLGNQGQDNAVNLSFQFGDYVGGKDGIMLHTQLGSSVTEISSYPNGTAIVMPTGDIVAFSVVPWIPLINREGYGDYEDFNGGFGVLSDDKGYDMEYAVRGWASKVDGSSNGSVLQDIVQYLELSIDIAFITAPIPSYSGETPIIEFCQQ